jgi:hypothetical protein
VGKFFGSGIMKAERADKRFCYNAKELRIGWQLGQELGKGLQRGRKGK